MKTIRVRTGRPYSILIGGGLLDQAGEQVRAALPKAGKIALVTDSTAGPLYLERVAASLERAGFTVLRRFPPRCWPRWIPPWEGR